MEQFGRRIYAKFEVQGYSFEIDSKNLDIFFEVEKTSDGQANKGEISVYNMNQIRANALREQSNITISIYAGYGNIKSALPLVFKGDIANTKQIQEGGDIKTIFSIATSLTAKRTLAHDKSWGAGVTLVEVVEYIAKKLKYDLDPLNLIRPHVWKRGTSISSNLHVALDKVLTSTGHKFTIDDNVLKIWAIDLVKKTTIHQINEQSGLIGFPEYITEINNDRVLNDGELPETDVDKVTSGLVTTTTSRGFSVKTLLNGKISPNDKISLTSPKLDEYNTTLTVDSIRHVGSNYGEDFYSEMKAFKGDVDA